MPGKQEYEELVEAAHADPALEQTLKARRQGQFGLFESTQKDIVEALPLLATLLDSAIAALSGELTDEAEARVRRYFPVRPDRPDDALGDLGKIVNIVRRNLEGARQFLGSSFDDIFSAVMTQFGIDQSIVEYFRARPDLIARELGGIIYIRQTNFILYVDSPLRRARVILHEAMHVVLTGGNEDAVYLEEGVEKLEDLPIEIAITNADSYVAFVLDDQIGAAKVFKFELR